MYLRKISHILSGISNFPGHKDEMTARPIVQYVDGAKM